MLCQAMTACILTIPVLLLFFLKTLDGWLADFHAWCKAAHIACYSETLISNCVGKHLNTQITSGSKPTGCETARRARELCYVNCLGNGGFTHGVKQRERCRSCQYVLHKAYPTCSEVVRTWWSCCFNKYCHLSLSWHTHFCMRDTKWKKAFTSFMQEEHCCFLHTGKRKSCFFHWSKLFLLIQQASFNWEIREMSFGCFLNSTFY